MRILFLGGGCRILANWLERQGENVIYTEENVTPDKVRAHSPDMIVSYNYRHILKADVLRIPPQGCINLHISYLPWNRGASPNIWSFIDNTPKGVTIHAIDEGVDTGDILLQAQMCYDASDTLRTFYAKLHKRIQHLFKSNWAKIKAGEIAATRQVGNGSAHLIKEDALFEGMIKGRGWDTPVIDIMERAFYDDIRACSHGVYAI
jgi:methionyl-tRNA formyltransferase